MVYAVVELLARSAAVHVPPHASVFGYLSYCLQGGLPSVPGRPLPRPACCMHQPSVRICDAVYRTTAGLNLYTAYFAL